MKEYKFRFFYGIDGKTETYFHKDFTLGEIEAGDHFDVLSDNPLMRDYTIVGKEQYTGKNDKLGVEVYGGDKVEFDIDEWGGPDNIHVVSWDERDAGWCFGGGLPHEMEYRTVIGNIYENPEDE